MREPNSGPLSRLKHLWPMIVGIAVIIVFALAMSRPAHSQQERPQAQNFSQSFPQNIQRVQAETPDTRLRPIDWDAVERDLAIQARRNLSSTQAFASQPNFLPVNGASQEDVAAARLPLLLPRIRLAYTSPPEFDGAERGLFLFARPNFYTATFYVNGAMVELMGTRVIHVRLPATTQSQRVGVLLNSENGFVTRTESGIEMSFDRYGASYTITLSCDDMEGDPRCLEPDYIQSIARSLEIRGGQSGE
ncbi:hypothetical protein [Woodsholea maritima]|uniref:hypothetical protein n=1 Tax=Woodsholea maritima TaxID=240237 RepID=UPI00059279E0|nr:hypothetical protein [Woodsholea maritima]